jgi:hypothetical protein
MGAVAEKEALVEAGARQFMAILHEVMFTLYIKVLELSFCGSCLSVA